MTSFSTIIYQPGEIARVTLNRPEKRNALSKQLMLELMSALALAYEDQACRVVVINANGPDFSAGHDYNTTKELGGKPRPWREDDARKYLEWLGDNYYFKLWDYKKPLIAAVHGRAIAGGAELAALCDITVAARSTTFGWAPLRMSGVQPSFLLPWIVGMKKAHEIYLTGGTIDAEEAQRVGLINRVVKEENLLNEAMRFAKIIALIPPEQVNVNKIALRFAYNIMGLRNTMFYGHEADILVHLKEGDEEFLNRALNDGVREAARWRDEPFEKLSEPYD